MASSGRQAASGWIIWTKHVPASWRPSRSGWLETTVLGGGRSVADGDTKIGRSGPVRMLLGTVAARG